MWSSVARERFYLTRDSNMENEKQSDKHEEEKVWHEEYETLMRPWTLKFNFTVLMIKSFNVKDIYNQSFVDSIT